MVKKALLIDSKLCYDCKSCEVACRQENQVPLDSAWIKVLTVGPKQVGDKVVVDFIPSTCRHCAKPPCADVCPTDAIQKRSDGVVTISEERCVGCMSCLSACPFHVVQFSSEKNVAEKCNLCVGRIDKGLEPACVHHCPGKAILFGDINEISEKIRQ